MKNVLDPFQRDPFCLLQSLAATFVGTSASWKWFIWMKLQELAFRRARQRYGDVRSQGWFQSPSSHDVQRGGLSALMAITMVRQMR